jgi:hypothetical protein
MVGSTKPDTHTESYANSNGYTDNDSDTCAKSYSHTTGAPEPATATVVHYWQ